MGRIDEEHMAVSGFSGIQLRLQFGVVKSRLGLDVLGQVFLGGTLIGFSNFHEFKTHVFDELTNLARTRRSPVS